MNKSQLIDKVSKEFNLDRASAKKLVECLLESIAEVLMSGKRIEMRGFGVLKLKKLKGTFVKNPKNGIELFVGERYTVRFKPSKRLLERLNEKA
jgi:nucleoid DNA-binding protein